MQKLNRMAIVVMPRESLVDWLNTIDPEHPVWAEALNDQGTVYLIPEFEMIDEAEEWLEDNFEEIFCNELVAWISDEKLWPQERTFEMFSDWFDVLFDVIPFDMVSGTLRREQAD